MQWIRQLDNSLSRLFGEESYSLSLWPLIHKSVHGTHILVVLPAVVWLLKPMTAKDTMKKVIHYFSRVVLRDLQRYVQST